MVNYITGCPNKIWKIRQITKYENLVKYEKKIVNYKERKISQNHKIWKYEKNRQIEVRFALLIM